MEKPFLEHRLNVNRRHFLGKLGLGVGGVALGSLLAPDIFKGTEDNVQDAPLGFKHFPSKAKRIIYLFQNGAPSQLESFDYKPTLNKMFGEDLPESIRGGQRLTGMTANQEKFPLVGSKFSFSQYGQSGTWVSELFPNIAKIT